jgi:hypothetical protein
MRICTSILYVHGVVGIIGPLQLHLTVFGHRLSLIISSGKV